VPPKDDQQDKKDDGKAKGNAGKGRGGGSMANKADSRDIANLIQAQKVLGGIHVYADAASPDLVSGGPTPDELATARDFFVVRGGLDDAAWRLNRAGAVLLAGNGTGWYIAALRLLLEISPNGVAHVNPPRQLTAQWAYNLGGGTGYVWHARQAFEESSFNDVCNAVVNAGSKLVVLVHRPTEVPAPLRDRLVTLGAPDPGEVARACVRAERSAEEDKLLRLLDEIFGDSLGRGTSPRKAARAAELVIQHVAGELGATEAAEQFNDELSTAVQRWFDPGRSLAEYAVMAAVSVLEDLSSDAVFIQAAKLERAIRRAELPADKLPKPRPMFQFSRDELLAAIGATVERRDHPRHGGLAEEAVRFARHDWAAAMLRHAWTQYPALQPVFVNWMARKTVAAKGVPALCDVILDVPASDPLRFVEKLSSGWRPNRRAFAAATLSQLATQHSRHDLVAETLERWIKGSNEYRKATAAMVYGLPYGLGTPNESLTQLVRIGRSYWDVQHHWVVWAVGELFRRPGNQLLVLEAMCSWIHLADRTGGLRTIALLAGRRLTGVGFGPESEFPAAAEQDRQDVRRLTVAVLWHVLCDATFGPEALDQLLGCAQLAHVDDKKRARLMALMDLVVDGVRPRVAMRRLVKEHPLLKRRIRRLFRRVRQLEERPWWAVVAGWAYGSRRSGQAVGPRHEGGHGGGAGPVVAACRPCDWAGVAGDVGRAGRGAGDETHTGRPVGGAAESDGAGGLLGSGAGPPGGAAAGAGGPP